MQRIRSRIFFVVCVTMLLCSLFGFVACGTDHQPEAIAAKAATCTDDGNIAYYFCNHCGKNFADEDCNTELSDEEVIVPALGHSLDHHDAVATTCTTDGNIEYWSCDRCELLFSDAEGTTQVSTVTLKAAHTVERVPLVEPTTEKDGAKEHYECIVCHKYFSDSTGVEEISADEFKLDKLVATNSSVNVKVYGLDGTEMTTTEAYQAISGKLDIIGSYSTNTYEGLEVGQNGAVTLSGICVGTYTAEVYGYNPFEFEVEEEDISVEIALYMTIAYASNDKVTVNNQERTVTIAQQAKDSANNWTGSAELVIPESIGTGSFVFDINVRMEKEDESTWGTLAYQRYAIQLTNDGVGFYFWSWMSGGAKTRIREFNYLNITNSTQENDDFFGESGELSHGYIYNAIKSDEGINLRVLRMGNMLTLLVQNGTDWENIGSIGLSASDSAKVVVYGVTAEYHWSAIEMKPLTYYPATEPAGGEPGNAAYYTDGERYWFEDGTETTENGVLIYEPVSVTLNIEGKDLDGQSDYTIPDDTIITFKGRFDTYEYVLGQADDFEMIAGAYTVSADGYRTTEINVPTSGGTIDLTLIKVISIEGEVADYEGDRWSDSVSLDISDELKESTAVILEFTVRNVTNSSAGWPTPEWGSQRIAIQMAEGNEGFLFFLPSGEANIFDLTDGGIDDSGKTRFGESGSALSWIDTLMRGESGVNMRLVRTGANVTLFVQNAEAEWVKIGTVACGSAATEIVFYGCGVEWEFSSVTAEEINYIPEKEPVSADEPGNIEYYTDGTNYWLPNGTATTLADVTVKFEVAVDLTLNGIALDGTTEAVAEGTVITFTSARSVYTYTVGQEEALRLSPDTYTVTADGYRTIEVVIPEKGGTIDLTLIKVISIEGEVADYEGDRWSDSVALDISEELKASTAVILEFNVRNVTNSAAGWPTDEWASQRIAIQMAQGNEGFLFFLPKGEANIFDMTDGGIADSGKTKFSGSYAWIDTLMRGESGVNMRLVRTGENVTLFVQNAEAEWVKIGTVACSSAATEIVFYGCGVEWEFSSVTAEEINYVPEKEPVSTDEPGNIEYYTDGTNYWLPNGTATTLADVTVKFEVAVDLTLNGIALDGTTTEAVANGTEIVFTSSKATATYTVGQTEQFKLSPDTYTVSAYGYTATSLTVTEDESAYTLTLKKTIAYASNNKVTINSADGKISIAQQAKDSANNWTGSTELILPSELRGSADYELTFNLKMTGEQSDWGSAAYQRFAFRLTDNAEGFYGWAWGTTPRAHFRHFTAENLTNSTKEGTSFGEGASDYETSIGWVYTSMISDAGLDFKLTRQGSTVTMQAYNGTEWVELGKLEGITGSNEIVFYGVTAGFEWSDISIKLATQE